MASPTIDTEEPKSGIAWATSLAPTWTSLRGVADQKILKVSYLLLVGVPAVGVVLSFVPAWVGRVVIPWNIAGLFFASLAIATANFLYAWKCPEYIRDCEKGKPRRSAGMGSEVDWKLRLVALLRQQADDARADEVRGVLVGCLGNETTLDVESDAEFADEVWRQLNRLHPAYRLAAAILYFLGLGLILADLAHKILVVWSATRLA